MPAKGYRRVMIAARRRLLRLAACTAALGAVPRLACAQAYPSRPVRWVVPFPPGGGTDTLARVIGQRLSQRLGQQFVIDNRPGASANIGTEVVVRAPADGYTLLLAASVNAINAALYDTLPFDFIRDIAPVVGLVRVPNVMVVSLSVPAKTIPEFIAYAKANPRRMNVASAGNGTSQHVAAELFKMMAGIEMVHIPYRGTTPALADLLGGRVQVLFMSPANAVEYVRAGRLRALAVTSAARSQALPELPAVAEFLPGFEASLIYGVGAPRNTPAAIVDTLNREINACLSEPEVAARLAELDGAVLGGSAADFGKLLADETAKWGKVVRAANIKAD